MNVCSWPKYCFCSRVVVVSPVRVFVFSRNDEHNNLSWVRFGHGTSAPSAGDSFCLACLERGITLVSGAVFGPYPQKGSNGSFRQDLHLGGFYEPFLGSGEAFGFSATFEEVVIVVNFKSRPSHEPSQLNPCQGVQLLVATFSDREL